MNTSRSRHHPDAPLSALDILIHRSGMQKQDIAKALGITPSKLSKLLTGANTLNTNQLIEILDVIGFTVNDWGDAVKLADSDLSK